MGSGHQLFVIAKIGAHYRQLAAVHHQWLGGLDVLRLCVQLLGIFSAQSNRLALEQELRFALEFFRDRGPNPAKPQPLALKGPCPFPFTTLCLIVGTACDEDTAHAAIHELPPLFGPNQGDYDDGITVLDITDLSVPRYCFLRFTDRFHSDSDDATDDNSKHLLDNQPLTGRQYLLRYDEVEGFIRANIEFLDILEETPLIAVEALADMWPGGNWKSDSHVISPCQPLQTRPTSVPRSLVELSIGKIIDNILSSDPLDMEIVEECLRKIPRPQETLRQCFLDRADQVGTSTAWARLLQFGYAGQTTLDWAHFPNINAQCLKEALSGEALQAVNCINVSGTKAAQVPSKLYDALAVVPKLDCLYIMDKPSRNSDKYSKQAILSLAELYPGLIKKQLVLSGPSSQGIRCKSWLPSDNNTSPSLTAFPAVQLLVSYHSESVRRPINSIETWYLGDALLSPIRLITGLFQYARLLATKSHWLNSGTAMPVAMSFAAASSSLSSSKIEEIGTLPADCFACSKKPMKGSSVPCSKMRNLVPGEWTVVLTSHYKRVEVVLPDNSKSWVFDQHCKYGIVHTNRIITTEPHLAKGELRVKVEDFEICDAAEFLRQTAPEVDTSELQTYITGLVDKARAIYRDDIKHSFKSDRLSAEEACDLLNTFIDKEFKESYEDDKEDDEDVEDEGE